jgi:hypothetical protein
MTRPRPKNQACGDLSRPVLWLLALLLPLLAGCGPMSDEAPVREPPPHQGMN